ncbi:MAG TPA: class I SAM-dependent methyltransferase [Elusimicrobiota bacterium]|jgi:NDP-4-keto-2,6-dideoxyhexose 3-C-methyltransferase|nr:class I SAM-dependent methyltransferase [Elusimicrobiota bacterium]
MQAYRTVRRCRICGNTRLAPVLSLGRQALTGVFPRARGERVPAGPLDLVRCSGPRERACGLVQLRQSYDKRVMYGDGYGYRSGLNPSMVEHLRRTARTAIALARPRRGDAVVDIGSNDGTLLRAFAGKGLRLVGVDPTAGHFRRHYPPGVRLVCDFFDPAHVRRALGGRPAKVITSLSMFYDLDAPLDFMRAVAGLLDRDGVWLLEQSYLPLMIEVNAYDTVCHEHLEYYALRQILWMTERAGLKVVRVELNDVNGGSFALAVARRDSRIPEASAAIRRVLARERRYETPAPYRAFRRAVLRHRRELLAFFRRARARGWTVAGYGASTKGNVILQFCGLGPADLPCMGEVNPEKFGAFTPGTGIPIRPEADVRAARPDVLFVLPWHFRDFIVRKEAAYRRGGGRLFFPLPRPRLL